MKHNIIAFKEPLKCAQPPLYLMFSDLTTAPLHWLVHQSFHATVCIHVNGTHPLSSLCRVLAKVDTQE